MPESRSWVQIERIEPSLQKKENTVKWESNGRCTQPSRYLPTSIRDPRDLWNHRWACVRPTPLRHNGRPIHTMMTAHHCEMLKP